MVILNKIYTKTGDGGSTGLGDGSRTDKFDLRVEAFGSVDEVNSVIGLARLYSKEDRLDEFLSRIQNDLFDLGADLCVPDSSESTENSTAPLRVQMNQVVWLEKSIDQFNADLESLRSFIIPGGSTLGAHLHHARTVVRRCERLVVELANQEAVYINPAVLCYINRLSDFLFVGARYANQMGQTDILWIPGKNRDKD